MYKNKLYKELSRIGKGISNDKRLEILDLLSQSAKTVESISKETGLSFANTSRHLQVLKDSHLVKAEKNGNYVVYSVISPQIVELMHLLTSVGENELSEMKYIQDEADNQDGIKTLSLEEVVDRTADITNNFILDVRPEDEFLAGHIDTSINIPLDHLTDNFAKLPKNKVIIVYCRGRLCQNSNLATQLLNENGFNAFSLNSSYYDWKRISSTIS